MLWGGGCFMKVLAWSLVMKMQNISMFRIKWGWLFFAVSVCVYSQCLFSVKCKSFSLQSVSMVRVIPYSQFPCSVIPYSQSPCSESFPTVSLHVQSFHTVSLHVQSFHTVSLHVQSLHTVSLHVQSFHTVSMFSHSIQSVSVFSHSIQSVSMCSHSIQFPCPESFPTVSLHVQSFHTVSLHVQSFHTVSLHVQSFHTVSIVQGHSQQSMPVLSIILCSQCKMPKSFFPQVYSQCGYCGHGLLTQISGSCTKHRGQPSLLHSLQVLWAAKPEAPCQSTIPAR